MRDKLTTEKIAREKHNIGRALSQASHKIRIPRLAKGHIEPQTITFANQAPLEVAPDPVKHLKFKAIPCDFAGAHEAFGLVDYFFVVRGNCRISALCQQSSHQVHEVSVEVGLSLERDFRRLEIGSFDQPHPDSKAA